MDRKLVTFSLLSVQWQKYNKSYLDNFVPLFSTLLIIKKRHSFEQKDYEQLANDFEDIFSLPLPSYLVSSIIAKMLQQDLITKENGVFVVNPTAIIEHKLYIKDEIDSYVNKQNKIFSDFIKYCNEKYQRIITQEDANRILLSFIKENDVDIFFYDINVNLDNKTTSDELCLVGKYIYSLYKDNPDLYHDVVNFAVGNIAFNAMYFAPPDSTAESLKKCVFFFDSSFVFPLIGIDSLQREKIVKDIINEIRAKGGFVKIYKHTFDEIIEILETAKKYVESPLYNPKQASKALVYLRQEGYSSTRIELIIKALPRLLKENSIEIENQIPDKKLGINENELIDEINNNLFLKQNDTAERYAERTNRDVNSIIYTYEKRKRINSYNFVDAKYSFITENALLTRADKKIVGQCSGKKSFQKEFFPAAIPEEMLCAYLFLGSSNKAVENVTLSILATAYTSIRPSADLEALVKDMANKLKDDKKISQEEYNLVTATHLIKDCLTDITIASYENIGEDTIHDLIETAKDKIAIDERKRRKEIESTLLVEQEKNIKREKKAKSRAKHFTFIICSFVFLLLLIPYCVCYFVVTNIILKWALVVVLTAFCFINNHIIPFNIITIFKKIYKHQLKRANEYFELNING